MHPYFLRLLILPLTELPKTFVDESNCIHIQNTNSFLINSNYYNINYYFRLILDYILIKPTFYKSTGHKNLKKIIPLNSCK